MNGEQLFMTIIIAIMLVMLGVAAYFIINVGDVIEDSFPDGESFYVDGYLIDVEYVGGAFGYRARTVFFFDDGRVINVVDTDQVSVELNNNIRLELQNSKDGEYVYLINIEDK